MTTEDSGGQAHLCWRQLAPAHPGRLVQGACAAAALAHLTLRHTSATTRSTASSRSLRKAGMLKDAKSSKIAPSTLGTASLNTSASSSNPYAVASIPACVSATATAKRSSRSTGGRLRCGRSSSDMSSTYCRSPVPCASTSLEEGHHHVPSRERRAADATRLGRLLCATCRQAVRSGVWQRVTRFTRSAATAHLEARRRVQHLVERAQPCLCKVVGLSEHADLTAAQPHTIVAWLHSSGAGTRRRGRRVVTLVHLMRWTSVRFAGGRLPWCCRVAANSAVVTLRREAFEAAEVVEATL